MSAEDAHVCFHFSFFRCCYSLARDLFRVIDNQDTVAFVLFRYHEDGEWIQCDANAILSCESKQMGKKTLAEDMRTVNFVGEE